MKRAGFSGIIAILAFVVLGEGMVYMQNRNDNNAAAVQNSQDGASDSPDQIVAVLPDRISRINDGVFQGWGTSLCWWANRIGYSDMLSEEAAQDFFGKEGLKLNIVRYNIGGGDDPTHAHITRTDSEIPGYAIHASFDQEKNRYSWEYDWTQDAAQRNVLNHAIAIYGEDLIVEAFSNSPPFFLTESGCSSGAVIARQNNLKDACYDDFAKYLADVCVHFRDSWGIKFQSIAPMNEPNTDYWKAFSEKQEGCHFDPGAAQSEMLISMRSALDTAGLADMILSGCDETDIDKQIVSYNVLTERAKLAVGRIDTHSYMGSKRRQLSELAQKENRNLWMSEVDSGDTAGENAGEMGAGLWLAQQITTDMTQMTPSAWILWQTIDSHISKDGYHGRKDTGMVDTDGGYWGLAVADHDHDRIILTMKYYCFGQFTRYIRPGDEIIPIDDHTLAAYDPQKKQLIIVATNTKAEDLSCVYDLTALKQTGNQASVIRTSGSMDNGEKWAVLKPVTLSGQKLETVARANSVTTFLIDQVVLR